MKIKQGFMLREVASNYIVVPVGKASQEFNGLITLNSTGAFLWKKLSENTSREDLIAWMIDEYEIDIETATKDIDKYLEKLNGAGLIE